MVERTAQIETQRPLQSRLAEKVTNFFAPDILLRGLENLEKVRALSEENIPIIFMPNHLSNADAFAIRYGLKRAGFEDIAANLVFILGMKLKKNPIGKMLFNKAFNIIIVWPPSLVPKNEKEKQQKENINALARISAKEALKRGSPLVVFPEATRSRNGQLMQGQPGVFSFVPKGARIIPVGITGTNTILPPGKIIPRRGKAGITFGEPISVDHFFENFEENLGSMGRRNVKNIVMERIAGLLSLEHQGSSR